jgi:predicted HD superfamily hydrolase involved in NAD metabolism
VVTIDRQSLRARMAPELPEGLVAHIDRVVALARTLAERHGLDVERVATAAQGHDLLRAVPPAELLARAEERLMAIDPVERADPLLLHGPVGAEELRERFGVQDRLVLDAVRWHTTGHPDFPPEAWAVFVADKIEPDKVAHEPRLAEAARLAERSLHAAALAYLDLLLHQAAEGRWRLHPLAVLARNALLDRLAIEGAGRG